MKPNAPLKQPREVGLVDALLGDSAALGREERQGDGQQVRLAAQAVAVHPVSNQTHQVNLREQEEVCGEQNPGRVIAERERTRG